MARQYFNFRIENTNISFPYKPYKTQKDFLSCMLKALNTGSNALLESPTGTGKTLCLLCGGLGFLEENKEKNHKIFYFSRTHNQLSHIVHELASTTYEEKPTLLVSRAKLCPQMKDSKQRASLKKSKINSSSALSRFCQRLRKRQKCQYKHSKKALCSLQLPPLRDIEDLENLANSGVCPYYYSRINLDKSKLIIANYQYLLDRAVKRSVPLKFKNSIIIFDEAHNISANLKDNASAKFCSTPLNNICELLKNLQHEIDDQNLADQIALLSMRIDLFLHNLQIYAKKNLSPGSPRGIEKGDFIFTLFENHPHDEFICNDSNPAFSPDNYKENVDLIREINEILKDYQDQDENAIILEEFADNLQYIFKVKENIYGADASVDFYLSIKTKKGEKEPSITLDFECISSKMGFKILEELKPHSIILTSSTLSPMNNLENELGGKFPYQIQGDHVISNDQILVGSLSHGLNGNEFYFTQKRQTVLMQQDVGLTILEICKCVPDGMLIFFSSYITRDKMIQIWKDQGIFEKLQKIKAVCIESGNHVKVFEKYKNEIDKKTGGAILMGICRGKYSEGFDFPAQYARAVIVVGVPLPSLYDEKLKQIGDRLKREKGEGAFWGWYFAEGFKALNQSIGRVIRNIYDFGIIILLDQRVKKNQKLLSQWTQKHLKFYTAFQDLKLNIQLFFKNPGLQTFKEKEKENRESNNTYSSSNFQIEERKKEITFEKEHDFPVFPPLNYAENDLKVPEISSKQEIKEKIEKPEANTNLLETCEKMFLEKEETETDNIFSDRIMKKEEKQRINPKEEEKIQNKSTNKAPKQDKTDKQHIKLKNSHIIEEIKLEKERKKEGEKEEEEKKHILTREEQFSQNEFILETQNQKDSLEEKKPIPTSQESPKIVTNLVEYDKMIQYATKYIDNFQLERIRNQFNYWQKQNDLNPEEEAWILKQTLFGHGLKNNAFKEVTHFFQKIQIMKNLIPFFPNNQSPQLFHQHVKYIYTTLQSNHAFLS